MKILFIQARSTINVVLPKDLSHLPKPIGIVASAQFAHVTSNLAKQVNGIDAGAVLGCKTDSAKKIAKKVGCFLFIGSGRFHPIGVAASTKKLVYCFDPSTGIVDQISQSDILDREKKVRGCIMRFLASDKIGVLVSRKPGQCRMKEAIQFKKSCKDKKIMIFVFDCLSASDLENFPFIESWVNTACPRLPETIGMGLVNLDDLIEACPQYK